MKFRAYIAASLDGYVSTADGGVDWLEAFGTQDYGYDQFIAEVDDIVIGRRTFDQTLGFGEWPYAGKRVTVLTSRPVEDPPPGTTAWLQGPAALAARLRTVDTSRDVWVLGGPQTLQGFRDIGAVDSYDIFVMPVLLGDGVPLFPAGGGQEDLTLTGQETYSDGVVRVTYEPR